MMGQIIIELNKERYFPQEVVRGTLKFSIEKPLNLSLVKLEITGLEKTFIQSAHKRAAFTYSENNYLIKDNIPLEGPGDLENDLVPSEHVFNFKFRMPQYVLPSYSGIQASVTYNLNARVDDPDFQDTYCTKSVIVQRDKKVPHMLKEPVHFKSKNYFKSNDLNPGIYVEIAQTGYLAGDDIWGYITLKNMATLRLKNIILELIGEEYAFAQKHHRTTVVYRIKKEVPTNHIREGMPIQFIFPIPKKMPANYEGMFSSFKWTFEVRLEISPIFQVRANNSVEILG
jgi:hypothetical protein